MNQELVLLLYALVTITGLYIIFAPQFNRWIDRLKVGSALANFKGRIRNLNWLDNNLFELPFSAAKCSFQNGDNFRKASLRLLIPCKFEETFWIEEREPQAGAEKPPIERHPISDLKSSKIYIFNLETEKPPLPQLKQPQIIANLQEIFALGINSVSCSKGKLVAYLPLSVVKNLNSDSLTQIDRKLNQLEISFK